MFNYNTLEKDIEMLGGEVAEKKNLPEHKKTPERELIKQVITPLVLQKNYSALAPAQDTPAGPKKDETGLPDYLENSPAEIKLQVEKLIEVVFNEGLSKAATRAAAASPFIMDAFHDALTDKLYDELKKRKLV